MKNILIILSTLLFFACNNAPSPKIDVKNSNNSQSDSIINSSDIFIKNYTDYSVQFINKLQELGFKKVKLIDSIIIADGDTVTFPMKPRVEETTTYTTKQGNLAIAATIKWINYTTIDYHIEIVEFGKANHNQSGTAELSPGFILGAESEELDDGKTYFVSEFNDLGKKDCITQFRLGIEKDFCKIYKTCNGKIKDIRTEDFTLLKK